MHSLSKGSTTARGGRDEEERSLRKLIETAKKYKGRVPVITGDHQFRVINEGRGLGEETKNKELFIQRRV